MSGGCRLLVPDGSLQEVFHQLLADAGVPITYSGPRSYEGVIGNKRLFPPPYNIAKRLRPWDAPWVVADRKAELAFTGEDLTWEAGCGDQLVILDKYPLSRAGRGFTRLVVAVPEESPIQQVSDLTPGHEIWTEYPELADRWFIERGVCPRIRRCHGSLEAFSGIADGIFENTERGESLSVGNWRVIERLPQSQACLITYPEALADEQTRGVIEEFRLLVNAVIAARPLTMVKCNVSPASLEAVLGVMTPFGGLPTINELAEGKGYALEIVVKLDKVTVLLPRLHQAGATRILETNVDRFIE